jgi:hypothetical protein
VNRRYRGTVIPLAQRSAERSATMQRASWLCEASALHATAAATSAKSTAKNRRHEPSADRACGRRPHDGVPTLQASELVDGAERVEHSERAGARHG